MNKVEKRKRIGTILMVYRISQLLARKEVADVLDCTEEEITIMENGEVSALGLLEQYINLLGAKGKTGGLT